MTGAITVNDAKDKAQAYSQFLAEEFDRANDPAKVAEGRRKDAEREYRYATAGSFLTTAQAAEILGLSLRRVQALIEAGQLDAHKPGRDWLISEESVTRRLLVQEAQKAWTILGIPHRLWGAWWLGDPDEIETFACPKCGLVAYSPAGDTKYSGKAACPSCRWEFLGDGDEAI